MKTKDIALDLKEVGEDGRFTGYGSVFGNPDSYDEIVEAGAFGASLKEHAKRKTMPLMLWQHDTRQPIGVWESMEEDDKGLVCTGRLLKGVRQADEVLIMLKERAVRGLSIGYREIKVSDEQPYRRLIKLDLREVSVVSFPANDQAMINAVKAALDAGELPTLSEFEDFLRDAGGFSRSQAKAIAAHGLKHLMSQREAGPEVTDPAAFLRALLTQPAA